MARKRPWSFCQKCRWQVTTKHANTLDPTKSEWATTAVQAEYGNLLGNELTRNSSGNARSQSSQLAEPLWIDPGLKSGFSVHELISTLKKKRRRGINCRTFSKNPHTRGKSHHHTATAHKTKRRKRVCRQVIAGTPWKDTHYPQNVTSVLFQWGFFP